MLVVDPREALALVSLYLRRQEEFLLLRSLDGTATESFDRGLFFWVGTRELLPESWRWFGACVGAESDTDPPDLVYLAQSLLSRVQRALEARDRALFAFHQPESRSLAEDIAGELDIVALLLMGAVDVSARVAHRVLAIPDQEFKAAWQRRDWLSAVRREDETLAAVVERGGLGWAALRVLVALRNTVHGAAMPTTGVSGFDNVEAEHLVELPPAPDLIEALEILGGAESWSVVRLDEDRRHAEPMIVLERLLVSVLDLLNALMRATPVERLVDPATIQSEPPEDEVFGASSRASIRQQLGLNEASR